MSQEITDLQNAQTANAAAVQGAVALINTLAQEVASLKSQVATLTGQAADATQIPPITAALVNETNALTAAVAAVPA